MMKFADELKIIMACETKGRMRMPRAGTHHRQEITCSTLENSYTSMTMRAVWQSWREGKGWHVCTQAEFGDVRNKYYGIEYEIRKIRGL